MARPLAFRVTNAGTYLPINRKDVSFVTLNGIVLYLGLDCCLVKDKSQNIYLLFGSPEEPMMIPEGTVVGVHFAEGDDEDIEFLSEDYETMRETERNQRLDRDMLESLERMLNGTDEDGKDNLNS